MMNKTEAKKQTEPAAWPITGVRVDDDKVIIKVTGGNEAARWLCGAILNTVSEHKIPN
jgi:hypothetical protein